MNIAETTLPPEEKEYLKKTINEMIDQGTLKTWSKSQDEASMEFAGNDISRTGILSMTVSFQLFRPQQLSGMYPTNCSPTSNRT